MSVPKPVGTYCHHCQGMCPGHYVSPTRARARSSLQDRIGEPITRYDLQPMIPRAQAKSWSGNNKTATKPAKRAQYPPPSYKPKLLISENAVGYDARGELMFLYLRTIKGEPTISQRVRSRALTGLLNLHQQNLFKPCNKSNRPELREAITFNGTNASVIAGEINAGWVHLGREIDIGSSYKTYQQVLKQKHHLIPMLRRIDAVFANVLPTEFARQNTKIKWLHRLGFSPFSTLTLLRSAPSAVHVDGRNGAGSLACMTTVKGQQSYNGGAFCLVEYGVEIRVQPGELLIAATPFHWHCNLTPVSGLKFSVIAYFKDALQRKRDQKCSICGKTFLGIPKRKPRCPECLEDRGKK